MRRAVLVTGDADFKPLVESMVQIGMFVEIVGDSKRTSRSLLRSADASELLAFDEYFSLAPSHLRNEFPLPEKRKIKYQKGYFEGAVLTTGRVGNSEVVISRTDQAKYNAYIPIANTINAYVLHHDNLDLLRRFIDIQFPDVVFQK